MSEQTYDYLHNDIPDSWYKYQYPLPDIKASPKPSVANYKPENCAWLIEYLASLITFNGRQVQKNELGLRYENNTPDNKEDDIYVWHPSTEQKSIVDANKDGEYLDDARAEWAKPSAAMIKYEYYAKRSYLLAKFAENSPAHIKYFQDPPRMATMNMQETGRFEYHGTVIGGAVCGGSAEVNPVMIP
jgi:hypothetical protein